MHGGRRQGAGRPKGSPNKATDELRTKVEQLLEDNWEGIQNDISELTPKERIDALLKLLEFSLPKLNRTNLNVNNAESMHPITVLSIDPLADAPVKNHN